jgi:4-amino-4-deoxy-L-arabinose transferase-like glycosyltransferase
VDHFIRNHFDRFRGAMPSLEPWYAYFYLVPYMLLPWAPYAALALADRLRGRRLFEPIWRFAACWILPGLVLISLSSFRARNYAIPLLPPLVMAAGVGLHEYLKRRQVTPNRLLPWIVGAAVVGCACCAVIVVRLELPEAGAVEALLGVIVAGTAAAAILERRRSFALQSIVMFASVWIIAVGVQTWVMPAHDTFRPLADLGRRVGNFAPTEATVNIVSLPEVQIPFYIERPIRAWWGLKEFNEATARSDKPQYVVTSRDYVAALGAGGDVEVLDSAERLAKVQYDRDRLVLVRVTPKKPHESVMTASPGGGLLKRR